MVRYMSENQVVEPEALRTLSVSFQDLYPDYGELE